MDSHTSSDYSDWTADAGINLQPSTPVFLRKRTHRRLISSSSSEEENNNNDDDEDEEEEKQQQSDEEEQSRKKHKQKYKRTKKKSPRVSSLVLVDETKWSEVKMTSINVTLFLGQRPKARPPINREVSSEFRPSQWITDVIPRKSPFVPQMGDEVSTACTDRNASSAVVCGI